MFSLHPSPRFLFFTLVWASASMVMGDSEKRPTHTRQQSQNSTQHSINATALGCHSIIKCSTSAKTCDCPTGCSCNFPLPHHNVFYLKGYTINIFPKATATIDCSTGQRNCRNMVVNSDGDDVQVKCQGFLTCDSAKFIGQNIHVNCGANPNASPYNTANVCNKITCEGKKIDVKCANPSCKPRLDHSCPKAAE
jgi:hypothetical protein